MDEKCSRRGDWHKALEVHTHCSLILYRARLGIVLLGSAHQANLQVASWEVEHSLVAELNYAFRGLP